MIQSRFCRVFVFVGFLLSLSVGQLLAMELEATPGLFTGTQAPNFTAETHDGSSVTLSELLDEGPVVLIFYRGAWCPYCNLHLNAFETNFEAFESVGAKLLGVSIDLKEYANKTVVENGLSFPVISDPAADILKAYNLIFQVPADLATKYKNQPVNIDFYTKTGERVSFEASKKLPIKERVNFYTKGKRNNGEKQ